MKRTAMQNAEYFAARRRQRTRWRRMLACVATVVALCTVLLLIRPAVTLESPQCGLEEHTHGVSCYTQVTQVERRVLVCGLDGLPADESPVSEEPIECPIELPIEEPIELPVEKPVEEPEEGPMEDPVSEPEEAPPEDTVTDEPAEEAEEAPHVHTDACYAVVTEPADTESLTCPLAEDETHTHSFLCYGTWELTCPLTEHVHTDACRTGLSEEEQAQVDALVDAIDALPTDEELDNTLDVLADDPEALEAWYAALLQQVQAALDAYDALTPAQQAAVINAERLTELRALCEATVLDAVSELSKLTTVQGADTRDLIEVNLYDYGSNINDPYNDNNKYPGFQQDTGSQNVGSSFSSWASFNFGNNITEDLAAGNSGVTVKDGDNINATVKDETGAYANLPASGAMKPTLGNDGYPALSDGTSLSYLFSDNTYAKKQNKISINGLFLHNEETGAYTFNSRENHAQFDAESDTFTLYEQIISSNFMMYPFGNFLPFNDIVHQSAQASIIDRDYLQTIAASAQNKYNNGAGEEYATLSTQLTKFISLMDNAYPSGWTAADCTNEYFKAAGLNKTFAADDLSNLYSIDFDEATDFYFGMEMKMNFFQPKGGKTGTDGKQDMIFYFTGDDDVWVYIDGVLFLDLSGIHRHVGGEIDFVNGVVKYYALDVSTGDVSTTAYKTVKFSELVDSSQLNVDAEGNGTFKDYSTHSFNFYYMERGAGSGVCRMNFNFPLLKKNSISVTKELTVDDTTKLPLLGDPDFKFQILQATQSGEKTENPFLANKEFEIRDADNKLVGSGTTDTNGVFTLKAGQTAVFSDIEESAGSYFVRELLDSGFAGQYDTVYVNGSTVTKNEQDVTVDNSTFTGVDSPVKDVSDGSTLFRFVNHVDTGKLGSLSLTKKVTGYNGNETTTDETFTFQVTLDGNPLPKGMTYTVGSETRTVETEGVIVLTAGQTAEIENILAGTTFTVEETDVPTYYSVSYQVGDETTSATSVSGTVGLNSNVSVVAINHVSTYELPQTGGTGTLVYTAVGLLLCAAALGLYSGKKRRREAAP